MEFCSLAGIGRACRRARLTIGPIVQHPAPAKVRDDRAFTVVDEGSNEIRVEHRSASSPLIR
jgi:hypothetical protein